MFSTVAIPTYTSTSSVEVFPPTSAFIILVTVSDSRSVVFNSLQPHGL